MLQQLESKEQATLPPARPESLSAAAVCLVRRRPIAQVLDESKGWNSAREPPFLYLLKGTITPALAVSTFRRVLRASAGSAWGRIIMGAHCDRAATRMAR